MASKKLTAKAAIAKVLGDATKPMSVPDIIKAAVPLTDLSGATPGQTIYSVLYSEAKKGNGGMFTRVEKGTFKLNRSFKPAERSSKTSSAKSKSASSKSKSASSKAKSSGSKSKSAGSKSKSAGSKSRTTRSRTATPQADATPPVEQETEVAAA